MTRIAPTIAEAVSAAWHNNHGGTAIEIPVGMVATLALIRPGDGDGPALAGRWEALTDDDFLGAVREIWAVLWISDPHLAETATPLWRWAEEKQPDRVIYAVRKVAQAAMRAGLFKLTGLKDPQLRAEEDVLGPVLTELRSHGARKGLGEFHTPPDVADVMAYVSLLGRDGPKPGAWFAEDTSGTGGMIRAQAQALRELGLEPASYRWYMGDIDRIAVACAAANAVVWGLGPHVYCWCVDVLQDPTGLSQAMKHKQEALARRRNLREGAAFIAATRRAESILNGVIE